MAEQEKKKSQPTGEATPPPGEGESLEEAAKEAVREIERREGGAGSGDIG